MLASVLASVSRSQPSVLRTRIRFLCRWLEKQKCDPLNALLQRLDRLAEQWAQLDRYRRQLRLAQQHGWKASVPELQNQLTDRMQDLSSVLPALLHQARRPLPSAPVLSELLAELTQIDEEFEGLSLEDGVLKAVTDPIELEGVELGRFSIEIEPMAIRPDSPWNAVRIIALDPNPAVSRSDVTHPHVSDERLCAGDAQEPVSNALLEGRFGEAFILIRAVLSTYNPHSPYISLDSWAGRECQECGTTMDDDQTSTCQKCDSTVCDDCSGWCESCDRTVCRACNTSCAACDERVCDDCAEQCGECSSLCCPSCLKDDLCPDCLEQQTQQKETEDHEDESPIESGPSADAATGEPVGFRNNPNSPEDGEPTESGSVEFEPAKPSVPQAQSSVSIHAA